MKPALINQPAAIGRVASPDVQTQHMLLLDVRTPAEFEETHIEGAVLHPLSSLNAETVATLATGKTACVIICRTGTRAKQAAEKLAASSLSMAPLRILDGGMLAWESAGLPRIRGRKTISLERQVRIAAGSLVVLGVVLGFFVHTTWFALAGLVGAGLVFSGVTDVCGMALLLARMPWNKH